MAGPPGRGGLAIALALTVGAQAIGTEQVDAQSGSGLIVQRPCAAWQASSGDGPCGDSGFRHQPAPTGTKVGEGQVAPRGSALPFAASLVVPGAGQWLQDQRRWAGYILIETLGWVAYLNRRRNGAQLRDQYRTLAWDVARAAFGGVRVDGDFDYYEDLANFARSGLFDVDPSQEGVQPESDIQTFNGQVWDLAKGLFFPLGQPPPAPGSPAFQQALDFYLANGYADAFLWDWSSNTLERRRFQSLISESDEALRRATLVLGLIGVNHVLSAVDALISARLKAGDRGEIESSLLPAPSGLGWELSVRWYR